MDGAVFESVTLRRKDLRFPLPEAFSSRLAGAKVEAMGRRGKYLTAQLSSGETLIMHLGMSGRFIIEADANKASKPGAFFHQTGANAGKTKPNAHNHVIFNMTGPRKTRGRIIYNDPRRFGFMDLAPSIDIENCRHFKAMGPEPLENSFSPPVLAAALSGRKTSIKAALLDQRIVAGIGNIYACEALYRARLSPRRRAGTVGAVRAERLHRAIVDVLNDAIDAGGSTLRDFAGADGALGYFQHRFDVYDRAGQPCGRCQAPLKKLVQSGRSTFFCSACQR